MKTLIIITLCLLVLTIVLIILIAKKFLDKTDHILASNALVSSNINDEHKSICTALTDIISAIGDANKPIMDSIDVSNRALVNSINAIEEKIATVPNSEDIIDSDELVNRIAESLYNKMKDLQAKNSLSNTKTKKPSLHKAKTTGKLKTAIKEDDSQQKRIDEIAKQQNK